MASRLNFNNIKLRPYQVAQIRKKLAAGEKRAVLAKQYNVSESTISMIATGKIHKGEGNED